MSFVTTAPAPTNANAPTVWPQTTVELAPRLAPRLTSVCRYSSLRDTWLRGLITFVNTIEGPQNTSSSSTTPVYTDTLFWILTLLPMTTPGETTTFWPMLQRAPIRAPVITCEKCQIFVSLPMTQPSST